MKTKIETQYLPKKPHYLIKIITGIYQGQHLTNKLYNFIVVDVNGGYEYPIVSVCEDKIKKIQSEVEEALQNVNYF